MSSFTRFCCLAAFFLLAVTTSAFAPTMKRHNTPSARVWGFSDASLSMGAAVIEREYVVSGSGPAVLDRPSTETTKAPTRDRKTQGNEAWEVRIYNDGLNTREHVARSLVQVTGMSELIAYQTMMQAHQNGIAVVGRFLFEVAEMYHEELKRNGIVCDIVPVGDEH